MERLLARYYPKQFYLKSSFKPCCHQLGMEKNISGTLARSKFIYREKKLPDYRTLEQQKQNRC